MKNATILIVDDEMESLETISLGLELKGYTVVTYNNPVEALEEIRQSAAGNKYNLFIIDIEMPQLRGDELIKSLRQENIPLPPIIIMTGYHESEQLKNLECDDIINKPTTINTIDEHISRLVNND